MYDKTGITGNCDFAVRFMPDQGLDAAGAKATLDSPPESAPPLATAIEEQLGLKLVPARGNMDYIVIDHVERPTPN